MNEIFKVIKEYFDGADWPGTTTDGKTYVTGRLTCDNSTYLCIAMAFENGYLTCCACADEEVAAPFRARVSEFITRANFGMHLACFELDLDDGTLRCRAGRKCDGGVKANDIESLVYLAALTMDRYYPGLSAIKITNKSPKELIEKIEAG